ncbi:hypothetical protein [Staphylococcus sp. GDY8P73P]|uniref:hypothetical protein n=1 Tax=Staphylococcus sp. GDY8P73P TaxID=2804134 RepID=UPI001AEBE0C2|nr:hypothetical protein [Staphylococcus sp. GDY8P73P]
MINAKDLIDDLQERAKDNQKKAAARTNELKDETTRFSSAELKRESEKQQKAPVHKNEEIAKLAVYLRILFNILRKQKRTSTIHLSRDSSKTN